jgi:hypothetical protein
MRGVFLPASARFVLVNTRGSKKYWELYTSYRWWNELLSPKNIQQFVIQILGTYHVQAIADHALLHAPWERMWIKKGVHDMWFGHVLEYP